MKIAVVGQFEWYGCMGVWVADAWEGIGYEVVRIDRRQINKIPDEVKFVVFVDCSEDFSAAIGDIKQPKIFWSLDAHMPGGAERSVNIARKCDLVFSGNYEYGVKVLEKFGIESILMPVTFNPRLLFRDWDKQDIDVCMIGHANSQDRVKLWELLKNYKSFTGKAETEGEYRDAMRSAKIVINQPTEPWDIILNNRFFEAMASRSLLLQKKLKTKLIEKLGFIEGKHFIYWDDFDDLVKKINFYLANEESRVLISTDGYLRAMSYSMTSQAATIEAIALSKFYDRL